MYVLIVFLLAYSTGSTTTATFETKDACIAAANVLQKQFAEKPHKVVAICASKY